MDGGGEGLDREDTCILRGMKMVDSSNRLLLGLSLIEAGKFYYYGWRLAERAKTSNPLQLLSEEGKERWLLDLCDHYGIPLPDKSGCVICPIFYKYASGEERQSPRFKIAQRFIERRTRQKLPHYCFEEVIA